MRKSKKLQIPHFVRDDSEVGFSANCAGVLSKLFPANVDPLVAEELLELFHLGFGLFHVGLGAVWILGV